MGWFLGLLFGALVGAGAWMASQVGSQAPHAPWRAGAPGDAGGNRTHPWFQPTRAPGSGPGSEDDDRQIRPPVQRGPDDFYRKPPRERKPTDKMYA